MIKMNIRIENTETTKMDILEQKNFKKYTVWSKEQEKKLFSKDLYKFFSQK